MIAIEYDSTLLEQAAFLAARKDQGLERLLHQAIDPLYEIADEESRQQAFQTAFRDLFTELELDRVVSGLLAEQPLIGQFVGKCIVRPAHRSKHQSAELYVQDSDGESTPSDRTLLIHAVPDSFIDREAFIQRMRRELFHVADMVDERFAYQREVMAGMPSRQNLVRDRYRVLWDVYVEGRLAQQGRDDERTIELLRGAFKRVFAGFDVAACEEVFHRVFHADTITHDRLLKWARAPNTLFDDDSGNGRASASAHCTPGDLCPLCRFPTYDWFDFQQGADDTLTTTIRVNHPDWSSESGACRQCAEIYAAASATG